VHLVKHYYKKKKFCVITPYDAQRNLLQRALKSESLPSDNVYNVDSFQGNEAEYILLSIVRTQKPGFLTSQNRVNVMLTRCKRGLIIVSNRSFIHLPSVQDTLLGKMCTYWEREFGEGRTWRSANDVMNKRAILPPHSVPKVDLSLDGLAI